MRPNHPPRALPAAALRRPATTRGFTLVELMVVIAIIGILAAIAVVVAGRVTQGGKTRLTQDLIRTLDSTLADVTSEREGAIPSFYTDPDGRDYPMIDARRVGANTPLQPSLAIYLASAREVPAVDQTIKGLDPQLVRRLGDLATVPTIQLWETTSNTVSSEVANNTPWSNWVTVLDAFGNPIRFVHPAFDGGHGNYVNASGTTITRDNLSIKPAIRPGQRPAPNDTDWIRSYRTAVGQTGSADEGICPNNRPYFYSAGADGDPGAREDNVYTTRPEFPAETAALN